MFCSVLTPYVYKYDRITNDFTQWLVFQTLDSVPGLRTLRFTLNQLEYEWAQLAKLRHLQEFSYSYFCTDEVVEQLRLHCTHLKKVSLSTSRDVTNASVQHLLQLKELQFLNLDGTQIDSKNYGLLLSELPQIKDISFRIMGEDILDHVAEKDLHKVSHVRGYVCNISMLAQRCRYITNLYIELEIRVDLSGLAVLTTLRTVIISNGHYVRNNLNAALSGIGPRLTNLTLRYIDSVNLQDIVTLCQLLASLSLVWCTWLPSDTNTPIDPQLPHFRNLISLRITNCDEEETTYNYIRHYVSLKKIYFRIRNFNVEFMREVVRSGTFAQMEDLYVELGPGRLTMEDLEMLLEHCPYLKTIGSLGCCCSDHSEDLINKFQRRLFVRNFDLELIM
jgi:Leucine-rich repeat (LRR) protein